MVVAICGAACKTTPEVSEAEETKTTAATTAPTKAETLAGRSFVVATKEGDKTDHPSDTLVFTTDTFESVACREWGFGVASYTTATEDGVIRFTSTATSPKEGSIQWTGTVDGGQIKGEYVWKKEGQADIHYTFEGPEAAK